MDSDRRQYTPVHCRRWKPVVTGGGCECGRATCDAGGATTQATTPRVPGIHATTAATPRRDRSTPRRWDLSTPVERITGGSRYRARQLASALSMNADGTYGGGYGGNTEAWSRHHAGVCRSVTPGPAPLLPVSRSTSRRWAPTSGQCADIYVWSDAAESPGNVLCLPHQRNTGRDRLLALPPRDLLHRRVLRRRELLGRYWETGLAAMRRGSSARRSRCFGGCPYTNNAPGIGFPTGWLTSASYGDRRRPWASVSG